MPKTLSPLKPTIAARHVRGRRGVERGFTLLEVVLAFSILAIGMSIAMQIATTATRQAQQASEHTQAALYAQNVLDAAGLDEPLQPGESRGDFDSGYRWLLRVEEFEPQTEALPLLLPGVGTPVQLLELELTVEWDRGNQVREAQFRTVRAVLPDMLR
jgi:general secretion pathway protein I